MTTTTSTYHFLTWTGPTTVEEVGKRLAATPGGTVTVVGTERVHYSIDAPDRDAAEYAALVWWAAAGLRCYARHGGDLVFIKVR